MNSVHTKVRSEVSSLGKCDVKGCEREAMRASVAILPDGRAVPAVVCLEHYAEGTENYRRLHPTKGRKGKVK